MRFAIIIVCAAAIVARAQSSISAPSLGHVFDRESKSVRSVLGVPGSAFFTPALPLGIVATRVAFSSIHDHGLAGGPDGVFLLRLGDAKSAEAVAGLDPDPDLIAVNPAGTHYAAYYRQAARIVVVGPVTGEAPAVRHVDAASLPGPVETLVLDDTAAVIAASVVVNGGGDESQSRLFMIEESGTAEILSSPHISALAFVPGSRDLIIADDRDRGVVLLRDGSTTTILAPSERLAFPTAIFAPRKGPLLIASATERAVAMLDLSGPGEPAIISCHCSPSSLRGIGANPWFLLTEVANGLVWMLDAGGDEPRIFFVPAEVAAGGGL